MTVEEICQKKKHGDLKTAGAMIGLSEANAYAALKRQGSKHHDRIVGILSKVISTRDAIAKEVKIETQS